MVPLFQISFTDLGRQEVVYATDNPNTSPSSPRPQDSANPPPSQETPAPRKPCTRGSTPAGRAHRSSTGSRGGATAPCHGMNTTPTVVFSVTVAYDTYLRGNLAQSKSSDLHFRAVLQRFLGLLIHTFGNFI